MKNKSKYGIKNAEIATCFGKCNFSSPCKKTFTHRAEAKFEQNRKDTRKERQIKERGN